MTPKEKKIETALQDWFILEGWEIDDRGDHFANWWYEDFRPENVNISINITNIAKFISEDLER